MKKAIVLLLALAVLGGAVFAQDAAPAIKMAGEVYGGIMYHNDTGSMLFNRFYGVGSYDNMFRVRLTASYTNANVGAKLRYTSNDFSAPTVAQGLIWATFADNMIKVKVGKLDDYTWATSWNVFGNFDGQTGAQFIVTPMEGLSFGAFVPVAIAAHTTNIAEQLGDADFGMGYTIANLGALVAGFQLSPVANSSIAYFGFNLTGMENVIGKVEGKLSNLGSTTLNDYYFWERAGYVMDKLTAMVSADQNVVGTTFAFSVTPAVEYATDMGNPGIGASVMVDAANAITYSIDPYVDFTVSAATLEIGANVPVPNPENFKVYSYWALAF
jgi:hypothetical protein